jgi:hypothetical protein
MRYLLVVASLTWLGCTNPNPDSVGGGGDEADMATGGGGETADLAMPAEPDLGAEGAACTTACDCQTGLGCLKGKCMGSQLGMLYCCESKTCPAGGYCQSQSGQYAMCGGGPIGGGKDGGFGGGGKDGGFGGGGKDGGFGGGGKDGGFGGGGKDGGFPPFPLDGGFPFPFDGGLPGGGGGPGGP